jgi:hypothetical protein
MAARYKYAAVGVVVCVAAAPHDQFCRNWGQQGGAYCNAAWDVPHGPHSDTGRITFVSTASIAVSTSSSSGTMLTPDWSFMPIG